MGLQFIIGSAVEDHTQKLVELSDEWLNLSKENDVFYLVPNHVKFQTEIHVLKELSKRPSHKQAEFMASTRLQVFSFSRLAWYFLQNTEEYQKQTLSQSGKYMLLKKVLLQISNDLTLFQYDISQPGFVEQLVDLFDEMQEGLISPEDLTEVLSEMKLMDSVNDEVVKLTDIHLIYQAYISELALQEVGSHELIPTLIQYLSLKKMKNVLFVVSGFSNFTAEEQQLIDVLMKISGEFKIGLVLDKSHSNQPPEINDLFYNTGKLYYDLYQSARKNQVNVLFDIMLKEGSIMSPLDLAWQKSQKALSQKERREHEDDKVPLKLWKCHDSYEESISVAKEIKRLVLKKNYRYRDIVVLTRDIDGYKTLLAPIFIENDIPFYFNQEEKMKYHPLVEFINALFNINDYFYQYKDVIRFLRTELFFPKVDQCETLLDWEKEMVSFRKQIDYTENCVLQYGIKGVDWLKKNNWHYINDSDLSDDRQDQYIEEQINEVRELIRDYVAPFFEKLSHVKTGREASFLLYQFMIEAGVEKQIVFLREKAIESGDLTQAKNHEQAWQAFVNLLDDYCELMGDFPFVIDDFVQIIHSGLEGSTYSKIPVTLDQIEVTSMDLVRAKKSRVTFIIGATDDKMPQKIENETLLTDEERLVLKNCLPTDKYLKNDLVSEYAREPFVFYLALLSAKEEVVISYPVTNDVSKDLKASPYLAILKSSLGLKEITKSQRFTLDNYQELQRYTTDQVLLSDWIAFKRELQDEGIPTPWLFQQLEKRLLKKLPLKTALLLSSLKHKNIPEQLTSESVQKIYGDTIYASVSKIENFNKCHYKYFLMYGLTLKEREKFELSPATTGDFYHEALDYFFKEITTNNLSLSTMTENEVSGLTDSVLKKVFGDVRFSILNTTNRMNYIKYQLSQTIKRASWSLKKQSERSHMSVAKTEVLFGQLLKEKGLNSLDFTLSNDKLLKVRGKIDRVDQMTVKDDTYLAVIDYKSSVHHFDFVDAYYGLAMQMITYLNVALDNAVSFVGKEAKMAGAFYMHIQNPIISTNSSLTEDALSDTLLKKFQYKGLLSDNKDILETLDKTIEPGKASLVYPYKQKANGQMDSTQMVTDDEMNWLLENNQNKFKEAGEAIFKGDNQLNPAYKKQERIACKFCPFKSVCQFDVMLKENNYHKIEVLTKKEMMSKWQEGKADENR